MSNSSLLSSRPDFLRRLAAVAQEVINSLNEDDPVNMRSLAINWRELDLLEDGSGEEKKDRALEELIDSLDPYASYAENDELLREEIERLLSDILDTILPSPKATPSPEGSPLGGPSESQDEPSRINSLQADEDGEKQE